MLIGLVIGTLAIQGSFKSFRDDRAGGADGPADHSVFRHGCRGDPRKLTGRSIYTTDRGHLHHRLLRRGFSNRSVLLCVSLFCLVTAAGTGQPGPETGTGGRAGHVARRRDAHRQPFVR